MPLPPSTFEVPFLASTVNEHSDQMGQIRFPKQVVIRKEPLIKTEEQPVSREPQKKLSKIGGTDCSEI